MKMIELREKSKKDLEAELLALLKERFNLRVQKGSGQTPNPHLFKKVKTDIARIKTLLTQKANEEGSKDDRA